MVKINNYNMRYLIWLVLLVRGTNLVAQESKVFKQFKEYITGHFDNSEQVILEIKKGQIEHPLSIHVNQIIDKKIKNRPPELSGFFLLEESYYLSPNKPLEIKPYLFFFQPTDSMHIRLAVYQIPGSINKELIRNDNDTLQFDFTSLQLSPTFKGATYEWNPTSKSFFTKSVNDISNGMRFTLIEYFTANELQVMELLEKDGKRITPYETPIIYKRKNK